MQASAPPLAVQSTGFLDCSARAHTRTHIHPGAMRGQCPRVPPLSASQSNHPHACVHAARWKQQRMSFPRDWAVAGFDSRAAGLAGARAVQMTPHHNSESEAACNRAPAQLARAGAVMSPDPRLATRSGPWWPGCGAGPGLVRRAFRCGAGAHLAKSPEIVLTAGSHASGCHITQCLGPDVLEMAETASLKFLDLAGNV